MTFDGLQSLVGVANLDDDPHLEVVTRTDNFRSPVRQGITVSLYDIERLEAERIMGDADGSGFVDLTDFLILARNFGRESGALLADGDFTSDGTVDFDDFLLLVEALAAANLAASSSGT